MADRNQLSFGDRLLSSRKKSVNSPSTCISSIKSSTGSHWSEKSQSSIKTDAITGGRSRKNPLWMIKATLLQSLFSLSDPQLEDQLIIRLSFQRFVEINLDQEIPDFTAFWRFKEDLACHNLDQRIFELINEQLEAKGLMAKKRTIFDASILPSSGRPWNTRVRG
jgi:transposase, IS5 family